MRGRAVVVAALLVTLAACTSSGPLPARSRSGHGGAEVGPPADGLEAVTNYAQVFCSGLDIGCSAPQGAVPDALRRPLKIPNVDPDPPCPVSRANPRIWSRLAPGLGPGPVAPVGLGEHAVLRFRRFPGSAWAGQKVLWVSAPDYDGPILIRGGRVDGPGGVGFDLGGRGPPLAELQLPPGQASNTTKGWRNWPSYTRVQAPGCYAYQVDGTDFSIVIVFRAISLG